MGSNLIKTFIIFICYHLLLASAWYVDYPPPKNNFEHLWMWKCGNVDLTYFVMFIIQVSEQLPHDGTKGTFNIYMQLLNKTLIICLLVNN